MTQVHDQTYVRGNTDLEGLAWRQDDGTTPVDISGFSVAYEIVDAGNTVLASVGDGIGIAIDGTAGLVQATIDSRGSTLPLGVHRYAIRLISSGGKRYNPVRGAFTVVEGVSDA